MTTIYIDESGDLGMGAKGSAFFIVTAVKVDNPRVNLAYNCIPKK
ncbi:DUF3800 domain-containing protein [Candidatus Woesearchaeota archaeon]|nr:DUF3800 domain-containing protein [Candidatus Woesearchaeota archaeon]